MKILILAESLRINCTSSGIVSSTMINALVEQGNSVTCLYENSVQEKITWLPKVKLHPVNYNHKESFLEKIPKLKGVLSFIYGYSLKFKFKIASWENKIVEILKTSSFDLIIVLGSGSSFIPHYAMCKVKTDIPWVANFHDPYPMSLYPEPFRKKKNIIYALQERSAKNIINKATYVSFPSLYLKDWMQGFFPILESKSIVLPHLAGELKNLPTSDLDDKVNLPKAKFNLLHAGTLLGPRKVDALFKAIQIFIESDKEKKDKTILTILGKVSREHKEYFKKEFSENLNVVVDRVSYKKSLDLIEIADVSLVIEAGGVDFSPFMPGKLADLIGLEKPIFVLSPKKSETNRILGNEYPFTSESDDIDKIVLILNKMWDLWKKGNLHLSDSEKLKEYISGEKLDKKLHQLIK
tara:strand:+ start:40063 stop:41289 length:1227 start_codon:yes stop_codon:yes gene_type:complete